MVNPSKGIWERGWGLCSWLGSPSAHSLAVSSRYCGACWRRGCLQPICLLTVSVWFLISSSPSCSALPVSVNWLFVSCVFVLCLCFCVYNLNFSLFHALILTQPGSMCVCPFHLFQCVCLFLPVPTPLAFVADGSWHPQIFRSPSHASHPRHTPCFG